MKVLLVRPPRYYWPFLSEWDLWQMPLAYPCLAGVLREHDVDVNIIDCCPERIGWKSLRDVLKREKPDIVACGDEIMFVHEGGKLFQMAKELDPETITIAGGHFHSFMSEYSLNKWPIDYIVRFEGEYTMLELVQALESGAKNLREVKGIAFKENGKVIETPPRPLIENLDELPMPAYDLLPIRKYGLFAKLWFHPCVTIEHSRGCVGQCHFCMLWVIMGEHTCENGKWVAKPRWRTKSVERTIQEMEFLYNKYKVRTFFFIDPTFDVDPKWSERFADAVLERDMDINFFAFSRADFVIRDHKNGVLKKMVDAGLIWTVIGVERALDHQLKEMRKGGYAHERTLEAFRILKKYYPQVWRQGTFINGVRSETRESMFEQLKFARKCDLDYPTFHSVTPMPGTTLWEEAKKEGWLEEEDFSKYDWYRPVMASEHLSREEIGKLNMELSARYAVPRIPKLWLISKFGRNRFRRSSADWFIKVGFNMWKDYRRKMKSLPKEERKKLGGFLEGMERNKKPDWYDT
jgi:anaerobic magnesium-protoporphyrin IX monomethyl ester cyclase